MSVSIFESEVACLSSIIDLQRHCQAAKLNLSSETNNYLLYLTLKKVGPAVAQRAVSKLVAQGELTWNEEEEFEVEQILGYAEEDGTEYFLIKWKGWSHAHDSWEPKQNIDCEDLIAEFERKNKLGIVKTGTKRKFDEIKVFDDRESKRSRIDKLFGKLSSCKQMITPIKLISLTSPDKGKKYRGVVSCEGLKAPKFNNSYKVLNKRSKLYKLRRIEIKKALQEWENHLNAISTDPASIAVENMVDLEGPPENFVYINDYQPGEGITIPNDPIIGCECTDCANEKKHCCAAQFGAEYAYYSNKRLRIDVGRPVYECNKRCTCGPECSNRVVQQGRKHKVCIFRTSNGRGWGVKALQRIKKGTFVMEYVGEVISNEEAETRGKTYDSVGRTYLFDLDFNDDDCPFTVDAAVYGNVSHFVNHSCDPNLEVYSVWINTLDPRLPRIALFSRRDIEKGEELTFDYMSSKAHSSFVEVIDDKSSQTPETNDVGSSKIDTALVEESSLAIDSVKSESQPDVVADSTYPESGPDQVVEQISSEPMPTDCEIVDMAEIKPERIALSSSPKKVEVQNEAYRMVCQCGAKNCRKFVF